MIFDALGVLLAVYALYCLVSGRVYAKRGPRGENIARDIAPLRYWTVLGIYAALAVALIVLF